MSLLSAILILLQKRALMLNAQREKDARCAVMDDRDVCAHQIVPRRVSDIADRFVEQMNERTETIARC